MVKTSLFKEMIPMAVVILLQRCIYFVSTTLLGQSSQADLNIFTHLYPIISIGILLELANVSTIVNVFSKRQAEVTGEIKFVTRNNLILWLAISLAALLFKSELLTYLKVDPNQGAASMLLPLFLLGSVILFSTFEGFLILNKKTELLSGVLFAITITNLGLILLFKHLGFNLLIGTYVSMILSYLLGFGLSLSVYGINLKTLLSTSEVAVKEFSQIWHSELKIVLVRSVAPIGFIFFLLHTRTESDLLTPYNLGMQLAYFGALPFLAGNPIAIREQSKVSATQNNNVSKYKVMQTFFLNAILPTIIIYVIFAAFLKSTLFHVFSYNITDEGESLLVAFFLASIIGQIGHFFALPVRSSGNVKLITRSFLVSEICVQFLLLSLFYFTGGLTPSRIGICIITFTSSYLLLNLYFFHSLKNRGKLC